jgi:hypothetical protein
MHSRMHYGSCSAPLAGAGITCAYSEDTVRTEEDMEPATTASEWSAQWNTASECSPRRSSPRLNIVFSSDLSKMAKCLSRVGMCWYKITLQTFIFWASQSFRLLRTVYNVIRNSAIHYCDVVYLRNIIYSIMYGFKIKIYLSRTHIGMILI